MFTMQSSLVRMQQISSESVLEYFYKPLHHEAVSMETMKKGVSRRKGCSV